MVFVLSSRLGVSTGLLGLTCTQSFLVRLSFMVKTPLYGLHSWLPKAHVEAPLIGSMLLSGVLLKIGSYGFLIMCPCPVLFFRIYLYLSLLGGLLCSLLCYWAWDIKSVIAYSSIIHIGVVTIGVLSGLSRGY